MILEKQLDAETDMPIVPEPLPAPTSLGGLMNFVESETASIKGLVERAEEISEDIEERQQVIKAIKQQEINLDKESLNEVEDTL